MGNAQRLRRVADQIQRELSALLQLEVKDPRIGMVTITGVDVSSDLAHAKVFFTSMVDDEQRRSEALAGLQSAAGFLRAQLGSRIKTHDTPQLHFVYDASVETGIRLTRLIDEALASDAALAKPRRRSSRSR